MPRFAGRIPTQAEVAFVPYLWGRLAVRRAGPAEARMAVAPNCGTHPTATSPTDRTSRSTFQDGRARNTEASGGGFRRTPCVA